MAAGRIACSADHNVFEQIFDIDATGHGFIEAQRRCSNLLGVSLDATPEFLRWKWTHGFGTPSLEVDDATRKLDEIWCQRAARMQRRHGLPPDALPSIVPVIPRDLRRTPNTWAVKHQRQKLTREGGADFATISWEVKKMRPYSWRAIRSSSTRTTESTGV